MVTAETKVRPICITCGWRLTHKKVIGERTYYSKECDHCSRIRLGKPKYDGVSCSSNKRVALRLSLNVYKCNRCGWDGYCDIHHNDRNPSNMDKGNLLALCPNCHVDEHHGKPNLGFLN